VRLWSVNPCYLDTQGLTGLWREALLAQKVLQGLTKGYKNHSQLIRIRATNDSLNAIGAYLEGVLEHSKTRGYKFNELKILMSDFPQKIKVTEGQLNYEWCLLLKKLEKRNADLFRQWKGLTKIKTHPLFKVVKGPIEHWERVK